MDCAQKALTVRKVGHDVVRTRVARHGDDRRRRVELANERSRRHACGKGETSESDVKGGGYLKSRRGYDTNHQDSAS